MISFSFILYYFFELFPYFPIDPSNGLILSSYILFLIQYLNHLIVFLLRDSDLYYLIIDIIGALLDFRDFDFRIEEWVFHFKVFGIII